MAKHSTGLPFYVPTGTICGGGVFDVPIAATANNPPRQILDGSLSSDGEAYNTTPGNTNKPPEEENGEGEEQLKEKPRKVPWTYNIRYPTQEERKIYNKIVDESDGFDCPYVHPEVVVPGLLTPVNLEAITDGSLDEEDTNTVKERLKGLEDMAALALKDYNQQSGKLYQFVKVVKACKWWGGGTTNNITFQAKEDTLGSAPQNFQARVFQFLGNTKVLFCRLEELCKPPTVGQFSMDSHEGNGAGKGGENGAGNSAPIPPNVEPEQVLEPAKKKVVRVPIARRGLGSKGNKIPLLTNHFKVHAGYVTGDFYHYSVALFYEDGCPVDGKGIGRKVLDRVHETYYTELAGKDFAYDGEKSLFTRGPLPRNKLEFTIMLEDVVSSRNNGNRSPKTFKVELSFAAKIPMQSIANALRGQESKNSQEALRVLNIMILRQHASKQGCLLVRQSIFHNDPKNFVDVGGGVLGCRGFHSSFRTTQGGLSLNIDVSTTMIIQPGPVVDFLIANQNVEDPFQIDWAKAKRTLKNLRIKTNPANTEYKIRGLSEMPCKEQMFSLKKGKDENGEIQTIEVTVYDYFVNHRNIELRYSGDLPCINVGNPKRPTYFPLKDL